MTFDHATPTATTHVRRLPNAELPSPLFAIGIYCHVHCGDGAVSAGQFMTLIGDQQALDTRPKENLYQHLYIFHLKVTH